MNRLRHRCIAGGYSRRRFLRDAALAAAALRSAGTAAFAQSSSTGQNAQPRRLFFAQPADLWQHAIPVGNGRLGAMIFGEPVHEHIQLNEETVWIGEKRDRNNPRAGQAVPAIRKLLFEGRVAEAETMAASDMIAIPSRLPCYQTLGDLWLDFDDPGSPNGYRLQLDLERAVASVIFTAGGVRYTREIFSSAPDQAIVILLQADQPGKISLTARLDRPAHFTTTAVGSNRLVMTGEAMPVKPTTDPATQERQVGVQFRAELLAEAQGGSVSSSESTLRIQNANRAVLKIVAATRFRTPDPEAQCRRYFAMANKPYQTLLRRHVEDYQSYFRRCDIRLSDAADPLYDTPTDQRLERVRGGAEDVHLVETYFQFGRCLLISASRPGTLAANLQGIWNNSLDPPWGSKYTVNINAEMNYWIAERANLADLHPPLFDLLDSARAAGAVTAQKYYRARGFVVHHNTDLWGDAVPIDGIHSGIWAMGAAWLSLHLWDHYDYSRDLAFLRERGYPRLREIAEFLLDYLVPAPDGSLATGPSLSPENSYVLPDGSVHSLCMSPVMDIEITRAIFHRATQAAELLNVDQDLRARIADAAKHLPPFKIGSTGALQEWQVDYRQHEPGHRHISHLWALFPDDQITLRGTPELAVAARKVLEQRLAAGGGSTGWSRAWIVACWARLEQGELAWQNLQKLLQLSTLPNLLDVCGIKPTSYYQIDGNLGGPSAIAEMLLASHAGVVRFLPALPSAWPSGSFRGLRARGGLEVDVAWQSGLATTATLRAGVDGRHRLAAPAGQKIVAIERQGRELPVSPEADGTVILSARRGETWSLHFA